MESNSIKYNIKKLLNRTFLTLCLIGLLSSSSAQDVILADFYLLQRNTEVSLHWTIDRGPTCAGITILRSSDSIVYLEVGNIGGICGSSSSAIQYSFTDSNPLLNQTNYYKLQLGFTQFSDPQAIYVGYTEPGKLIVKPNPTSRNVSIEFNNDTNDTFELVILNSSGETVLLKKDVSGNEILLNTTNWSVGVYIVTLVGADGVSLKQKFLIANE